MKIALFGATGRTGLEVVHEALERGIHIKALVRNPDAFKLKDDKITVQKVNIFDDVELSESFKDCDAVVSCVGVRPKFPFCRTMTFYEDSIASIVSAMRKAEVKRLICMSTWCASPNGSRSTFIECFRPFCFGNYMRSMADMETYLRQNCSDIEYTAVKPPNLGQGPSTGKKLVIAEDEMIPNKSIFTPVQRRDVAKFMLDCIENGAWKQACVAIGEE